MKFLPIALLVVCVSVAAADECCLKDELARLMSHKKFLANLQACINETPSETLQSNYDQLKARVEEIRGKWLDKCSKDKCSDEELQAIWTKVGENKGFLEQMKAESDCEDITDLLAAIQDIQDRCNF